MIAPRFRAALAVLSLLTAGPALATTSDGTLITNIACATFRDNGGAGKEISYCATSFVLVASPAVIMSKVASPTLMTSGGIVTFCISFSNTSAYASAFSLVITDRIPDNMHYYQPIAPRADTGSGNWGIEGSWSSNGAAAYTDAKDYLGPPNGPGPWVTTDWPATATSAGYYLRWTVEGLGPHESGYICYTATVD